MPTLLDAEQQAMAGQDTSDLATALGGAGSTGTASVPQSDQRVIAERLLGPELAERYGDVLGIRKETWGDFFRDMGNELGRRGNAERVKERVLEQYNQKYQQERQSAQQMEQENRLKVASLSDLIRSLKGMPKGHRAGILKAGLEKLGMAASPEVLKLFADAEKFDASELFSPEMMEMADENPQEFLAQAETVLGDAQAAIALHKGVRGVKQQKQDTQKKILDQEKTRAGIEQMGARTDLIRARTEKIRSGKGEGASKTPLLDKLRAGGPATPRTSTTPPSVTVRKLPEAGIPQE